MSSWVFEKVAPENLAIFTGTMQKPRFYDSKQSQNHTKEKGEGREESEGEKKKKTAPTKIFILPTLEYRNDIKPLVAHHIVFKTPGRCFKRFLFSWNSAFF